MLRLVRDVAENSQALTTLIHVNLKTSVATKYLGWVWWILDPLILMLIYYFMVRLVFDRGGENYHLFALCGIVIWQFFTRSLSLSSRALSRNRSLIQQIPLPFSVYVAIPPLVQLIFATLGIIIVMVWNYPAIGWHSVLVVPLLILVGLLSFGLGLFLSVAEVYVKDVSELVTYVLRAGFFLSPILYPAARVIESETIPSLAKAVFELNPFAWIIPAFRNVLLDAKSFDWTSYLMWLMIALVLTQTGLWTLRSQSGQVVKRL